MSSVFAILLYLGSVPLGIVKDPAPPPEAKDAHTIEYGYEERAPLYFGRKKSGELLLKTKDGKDVWIKPTDKTEIQSFEDILTKDHMTFFTQHWDTKLYYDASKSSDFSKRSAFRLPDRKLPVATEQRPFTASRDVEVLERKTVEGALWLKVKLVDQTVCATKDGKPVYAKHPVTKKEVEGWVPAKTDNKELNFWYYTRGC